ncbi:MAG TPA: DsbA family oxidoreductase [Marmoricola sp.]|nr:DsbA family oxidoreductase [Marmoricola sp.]HNN47766.1 DsbA family oxidoreductase [Marmoricola sp.]
MQIEIWSDVVCPWCYIGKRRLEKALGALSDSGAIRADEVEIRYRSFQLDPAAPTTPTHTVAEWLGMKYGGGPEAGRQMIEQVDAVAAEEGLIFRQLESQRVNTMDAHRLLHLAVDQGGPKLQGALKEALLAAYFTRSQNVADHETLTVIATAAGLDPERVSQVLNSQEYADEVAADISQAAAFGANGVPFFVVDRKYGVSGAQSPEVFTQVLERAWAETHPVVELVGGAEVCGPDGCTPT